MNNPDALLPADSLLEQIYTQCLLGDRRRLLRLHRELRRGRAGVTATDPTGDKLRQAIGRSIAAVEARRRGRPSVTLNTELPFYLQRDELAETIAANQVVIVCGETGSGKTTQLPQICIGLGLADRGKIGHTQPRRLAARAVSQRIAEELHTPPGEAVGYKVRFNDTTRADAYVKLMTDGILLAEIQGDRWLNEYQTLIIDEAHERNLNVDLLLGYIKTLLPKRPDLKLIITSATIDPERFSRYFDDAPMVTVSGRTYPVEMRYRPLTDDAQRDRDRTDAIIDALDELFTEGPEDTLVFLPGERQIRDAAERISKRFHRHEVLPLYSRLSNEQQQKIFRQGGRRRIILSTNVAETSLTVPGIRYVIDTGLARISRYSWRSRVQRLPIEKISRASAQQRAGRCGRVAPGICIRLFAEDDFEARPEFTEPEILRTNMASVILQMDSMNLGDIRAFDFIDPPDSRLITDGYRLLHELEAVDPDDRVTALGKRISRLPVDPRLARMMFAAAKNGCLAEVTIITAVLSVQDPRDTSVDNRQAANEKFKAWQNPRSDFLGWLKLWENLRQQGKELTRNQFSRWCGKNYLSWLRVREWQDIHRQLREQARELKLGFNTEAASDEAIHRAILAGIPSHIAALDAEQVYQSTRGRQLAIFPGSALAGRSPKWIMAFSLIDTGRLYAHVVSAMQAKWAVADLGHLHQYDYYEPHWQERQGRVTAYRNTRIYGLLIEGGKRVNFAAINPPAAREIFIREALVEGRYRTSVEFILANRRLLEHYREQEERERRRDLLVGDEQLYEFYDQRLPDAVVDGVSFETWAKALETSAIRELTLFSDDVLATEHQQDELAWPETLVLRQQSLRLSYVFDPSDEADGVTAWIPLPVLKQLTDTDFDQLVPGLLEGKVLALLKSLPKALRKHFIPAPDYARACVESLEPETPLLEQLSRRLQRMTGIIVAPGDWRPDTIDAHFQMRYCLEQDGVAIASGRSLEQLQQLYSGRAEASFQRAADADTGLARDGLSSWDFDSLPAEVDLAGDIRAFPALVDYGDSVAIELFDTRAEADFYHPSGIARLIALTLADSFKYLRKKLPEIDQSALLYISMGSRDDLLDDIVMASIFTGFLGKGLPADRKAFEALVERGRREFIGRANDLGELTHRLLSQYRESRRRLDDCGLPAAHVDDLREQCDHLVYGGFLRHTPAELLTRLPAYFQAINKRLDKSERDPGAGERVLPLVRELWRAYLELEAGGVGDAAQRDELRWMIEEFRINAFAQPMKTRMPVSEHKIRRQIESLRQASGFVAG